MTLKIESPAKHIMTSIISEINAFYDLKTVVDISYTYIKCNEHANSLAKYEPPSQILTS